MHRTKEEWEAIYKNKQTPWDAQTAEPFVMQTITEPCSLLDIGCGRGNEAIALAKKGCTVTAVDISENAIRTAKERANQAKVKVDFIPQDVLNTQLMD